MTDTENTLKKDALRPGKLKDFNGQENTRNHLGIILKGALERKEMPDHLLLAGPPGLGKTTLASIIAHELKIPLLATSGPVLEKPSDVVSLLTSIQTPSVLFIDEIHGLKRQLEELFYSAMEDGVIDVQWGEGAKSKTVRLPLKPFVLVGATTQAGLLSDPFRDRFGFTARLNPYKEEDLAEIIERSAGLLKLSINKEGTLTIAKRSRGTPRIANTLLRRVRDYAQAENIQEITEKTAKAALEAFGIDMLGLDHLGREILTALISQFDGGPVGLNTLAAAVGEAPNTLDQVYEPYLMRKGLIARTPRGRIATTSAYVHLGLPLPKETIIETLETDQLSLEL